jgi:hypothetical protein
MVKRGGEEGRCYSFHPHLFLHKASGQIFKDDVNRISSTSNIASWIGYIIK